MTDRSLRIVSIGLPLLLVVGETARWWGSPRIVPLALDEGLVAAALIVTALKAPGWGTAPLAAAWGLYSGLMLGLLMPTLDHLLFGPPKESAGFYAVVLSLLLAIGLWGLARSIGLIRVRPPSR